MGLVIAIVVAAIVAVVALVAVTSLVRRRRTAEASPPSPAVPEPPPRPEPEPMTGLEDALNQITDRSGTTMAARLDAETAHVEELRVVDDTGPLLRRALDHVRPADEIAGDPTVERSEPSDG